MAWTAVVFAGLLSDPGIKEIFVNSDQLYVPSLVEDLRRWSGSLADWYMTPAPYLVPDAVVYGLMRELGAGFETASYLAGAIQYFAIAFAARSLLTRGLGWHPSTASLIGVLFPALLAAYPWLRMPNSLFRITRHGFTVWMSLIVMQLCLREAERRPRAWTALTGVIATAFSFSDPVFVTSCVLPLALLGAYQLARKRHARPTLCLPRVLVLTLSSGAGLFALQFIANNALSGARLEPASMWPAFSRLRDWLIESHDGLLSGLSAVVLLALLAWRRGILSNPRLHVFLVWCLLSMLSTWGAMVASGLTSTRYAIVPWTVGAISLVAVLVSALERRCHVFGTARWRIAATAVPLLGLLASSGLHGRSIAQGAYHANARQQAACVEMVARKERSDFVLADYWRAKPLQLFSNGGLRAVQVDLEPLRPRLWINSKSWYRGLDRAGWSVLVANGLPRDALERYGKAARVTDCFGLEVRTYRGRTRGRMARELERGLAALMN